MGVADKYKRQAPKEVAKAADAPIVDPHPFFFDGCYIEYIKAGDLRIPYIPLTMAETLEINEEEPISILYYTIAKAFKRLCERGYELESEYLIDTSVSYVRNAELFLGGLPRSTVNEFYNEYLDQRRKKAERLVSTMEEYREELNAKIGGVNRPRRPNDGIVSLFGAYMETPYTFNEISNMTELQIMTFKLARTESSIRMANDSAARSPQQ